MTPVPEPRQLGTALVEGQHYRVDPDTGCWVWLGSTDKIGYGLTIGELRKVDARAHRAAKKLAGHDVPKGAHVHHACKTPGCVNDAHLEVTTATEHFLEHKLHDKTGLTLDDIREIRRLSTVAGTTAPELAKRYGVHEITIYDYWSGNHWAELLGGEHAGRPVRTCPECDKDFDDRNRNAKFCSKECRCRFNGRRTWRRKHWGSPDRKAA